MNKVESLIGDSQGAPGAQKVQANPACESEQLDESEQPIGEYVAGEVHDVRVTVRWLEYGEPDYERDPNDGHFVHLCFEVWVGDDGTEGQPDHWQIDWFHFVGLLRGRLREHLDECCPYPDKVWETALQVPLPAELKKLFSQRETKKSVSAKAESFLARLKAAQGNGQAESEVSE